MAPTYKSAVTTLPSKGIETAGGTWTDDNEVEWTYSSVTYIGFESADTGRGLQVGSSKKPIGDGKSWTISADLSNFGKGVVAVTVESSMAKDGNGQISVQIGETVGLEGQSLTTSNAAYSTNGGIDYETAITGEGQLVITLTATVKAVYLKSITVKYVE